MLTILCDLDDVLIDLLPTWLNELNRRYKTAVSCEDITDWDMTKFFPNLAKGQIYEPLLRADFWDGVPPTKDGQWFIEKLLSEGHTIKIVTASYYKNIEAKMNLLARLYPWLDCNEDVIITTNKHLLHGDVLIDDRFENLLNEHVPKKILVSKPHNAHYYGSQLAKHSIQRVGSLYEAYEKLGIRLQVT